MKKQFFLLFLSTCFVFFVKAQVTEGEAEFNKIKRIVKTMVVNQEPDIVEEAIKNKMLKSGNKASETKGWMVFKNVTSRQVSDEMCDLYVKVERKSRKEKESSIVYFFASKPNDNATPVSFAGDMLVAEGFYGEVSAAATAAKLEKDIKGQEDVVKKSEKKYDDLVKDQASLEKKIKGLQDDLEQNKQKQQSQSQDVENQRKILEELKAKRNS